MTWVRIDDGFPDHPKLAKLGDLRPLAGWLHVAALCYASRQLTDGFIPEAQVRALTDFRHIGYETGGGECFAVGEDADPEVLAQALVNVGLWHRAVGGFAIHDYLEYNPSRADVLIARKRNAKRQKDFRERNADSNDVTERNTKSNSVTAPLRNAHSNAPVTVPPSPSPSPETKSSTAGLSVDSVDKSDRPAHPSRDEQLRALARSNGLTPEQLREQADELARETAKALKA